MKEGGGFGCRLFLTHTTISPVVGLRPISAAVRRHQPRRGRHPDWFAGRPASATPQGRILPKTPNGPYVPNRCHIPRKETFPLRRPELVASEWFGPVRSSKICFLILSVKNGGTVARFPMALTISRSEKDILSTATFEAALCDFEVLALVPADDGSALRSARRCGCKRGWLTRSSCGVLVPQA